MVRIERGDIAHIPEHDTLSRDTTLLPFTCPTSK
jgi:hypothetical protein